MQRRAIAVIGQGFVGGSLTTGMSTTFDVCVWDAVPGRNAAGGRRPDIVRDGSHRSIESIAELVEVCETGEFRDSFADVYFVAVPTPMRSDGSADVSIVESVLQQLAAVPRPTKGHRIAVVKSTCPPGSTVKWNAQFESTPLRVVFNPEFLTEANAVADFAGQDRIVLGGPRPHINVVKQVYEAAFPRVPIVKTSSTTAEMVKYVTNVALAARVALANEVSQICEALDERGLDIDYDKVMEYCLLDKRLGNSHWKVPGPDGKRGFGGSCFPKDVNALASVARSVGVHPTVIEASWRKNVEVRPERDWEQLKGRAVVA